MSAPLPPWVEGVTALLAVTGALAAAVGSLGLLRLPTFFQRVHAPTLGTTVGTWSLTLATTLLFSFLDGQPFVHALLIPVLLHATAPITTLFLMRAALLRARLGGEDVPRPVGWPAPRGVETVPDRADM